MKFGWPFVGPLITQRFESVQKVAKVNSPRLVVHGAEDRLISSELGRKLYDAATGRKQFLLVEGGSHHNTMAMGRSTAVRAGPVVQPEVTPLARASTAAGPHVVDGQSTGAEAAAPTAKVSAEPNTPPHSRVTAPYGAHRHGHHPGWAVRGWPAAWRPAGHARLPAAAA